MISVSTLKKFSLALILISGLLLGGRQASLEAAVANFCWCGFFVSADSQDPELQNKLGQVYRKHLQSYEDPDQGVIIGLLNHLAWDDMTYYGYVGLPRDAGDGYSRQLENLDITYGLFLAVEQVLNFSPDQSLVHGQTIATYTSYIFGSLNIFHLKTRNLVSSRPFFITSRDRRPPETSQMLDLALSKFAARLADKKNNFTRKMLSDWQAFFGPPGEQRDILRAISGEQDNTFGIAPLCEQCIRIKGEQVSQATDRQLRTFLRYYFNALVAGYKPVVFLPGFQSQAAESVHSLVTATKEGDVAYSEECLQGYGDSGQTLLCLKVPLPRNLIKLSLRCLVEDEKQDTEMFQRSYTSLVDFAVFFADQPQPQVSSLSNTFRQMMSTTRRASDLYFFNSAINALANFNERALRRP